MKHTASQRFWQCLDDLPIEIQTLARRNYKLLKTNLDLPSLHFKTVGNGRFFDVKRLSTRNVVRTDNCACTLNS